MSSPLEQLAKGSLCTLRCLLASKCLILTQVDFCPQKGQGDTLKGQVGSGMRTDRPFEERSLAYSEVDVLGIRSHFKWLCWEDDLGTAMVLGFY